MSQLRMYRAWLTDVAMHTGNGVEELHEFLLDRCAPRTIITIKGSKGQVEIERTKRTSGGHALSMNKAELVEFMNRRRSSQTIRSRLTRSYLRWATSKQVRI